MPAPQLAAATTQFGVMLSEAQFIDAWREAGGDDPRRRDLLAAQAEAYLSAQREAHRNAAPMPSLADLIDVSNTEVEYRHELRWRGLMHQRSSVCG